MPIPANPKVARKRTSGWIPILLALAGIGVLLGGIALLKAATRPPEAPIATVASTAAAGPIPGDSIASIRLNAALNKGQPALVFMHSTSCASCIEMTKVVQEVYPDFAGQLTLVDVDVYDGANTLIMRSLGLKYIPTIVVYNRQGQTWSHVGVMSPGELREQLRQRALGS